MNLHVQLKLGVDRVQATCTMYYNMYNLQENYTTVSLHIMEDFLIFTVVMNNMHKKKFKLINTGKSKIKIYVGNPSEKP